MNRRELLLSTAAGITLATQADAATRDAPGASNALGSATAPRTAGAAADQIFELRQYTLHRNQRDVLISLFEKSFIEPHDAVGSHVYGIFRDADDPDRFVWLRGFPNMAVRQTALADFYTGPAWQNNRSVANATMLDSDNVLMLRPASAGSGLIRMPPPGARAPVGIIEATIYYLGGVDPGQFTTFFGQAVLPELAAAGVRPLAQFVSEESPNNFPKLPIRERERVFVCLTRWPDIAAEEAFLTKFRKISGWRDSAPEAVLPALTRKPERLRLIPAARSPIR